MTDVHSSCGTEHEPTEQEGAAVERNFAPGWPEDSAHENGNYENRCLKCGRPFIGHKRRFACKDCTELGRILGEELARTTTPDSRAPLPITSESNEKSSVEARDAALGTVVKVLKPYIDSYRQMAKTGDGRVRCASVAFDLEQNVLAAIRAAITEQDGKGGERG